MGYIPYIIISSSSVLCLIKKKKKYIYISKYRPRNPKMGIPGEVLGIQNLDFCLKKFKRDIMK
jgi:hypothetical protein